MMQRSEVMYHNLLRLLTGYTLSSPFFEPFFYELHASLREDQLINLAEDVQTYITEITASMQGGTVHDKFQPLIDTLNEFHADFPDYPAGRLNEILVIIKIISFIDKEVRGSGSVLDLTVNVNQNLFCLNPLTRPIPTRNFLFFDNVDLQNSVLLLDMSDLNSLENFIDNEKIPIDLLFSLLSKLGELAVVVPAGLNILIRASQDGLQNSIFACIALHIVKSGKLVHSPFNYAALPQVSPLRKIMSDKKYQQFNDSLIVLSEYNGQKDILDKYLRIYHLIENFMFKFPVVTLERTHQNLPFSIRDFRLLYGKIDKSEISVLKDLMSDVMKLDYALGVTFLQKLFPEWTALNIALIPDLARLNRLFEILNVSNAKGEAIKYENVGINDFPAIYSKLIYGFRNSLVHNRETEFHLTHETLINHPEIVDTAKIILENFLLPSLEEISFYLIIEQNNLVWYNNPALTLYNE